MEGATDAAHIVEQYFQYEALAKLGFSFNPSDLETFEADCFTIIKNELVKWESKEVSKGFK